MEEAVRGFGERSGYAMSLPLVHSAVTIGMFGNLRADLPNSTRTHFATWIASHPEFRPEFQRLLLGAFPALRASFVFGLRHNAFVFNEWQVEKVGRRTRLPADLSDETKEILTASRFVGRWFSKAGSAPTILSLLGFGA